MAKLLFHSKTKQVTHKAEGRCLYIWCFLEFLFSVGVASILWVQVKKKLPKVLQARVRLWMQSARLIWGHGDECKWTAGWWVGAHINNPHQSLEQIKDCVHLKSNYPHYCQRLMHVNDPWNSWTVFGATDFFPKEWILSVMTHPDH